jgi:hypothetical protein
VWDSLKAETPIVSFDEALDPVVRTPDRFLAVLRFCRLSVTYPANDLNHTVSQRDFDA